MVSRTLSGKGDLPLGITALSLFRPWRLPVGRISHRAAQASRHPGRPTTPGETPVGPAATEQERGVRRKLLRAANGLMLGLVGGTALLMAAVLVPQPFGFKPMIVVSGSMAPTLHTGDVAIVRETRPDLLDLGDVVTYKAGDKLITHRIIGIDFAASSPSFLLQGDANPSADPQPVPAESILGKVVYRVPRMGAFVYFANSVTGRGLLILLPAIALGIAIVRQLFSKGRSSPAEPPSSGRQSRPRVNTHDNVANQGSAPRLAAANRGATPTDAHGFVDQFRSDIGGSQVAQSNYEERSRDSSLASSMRDVRTRLQDMGSHESRRREASRRDVAVESLGHPADAVEDTVGVRHHQTSSASAAESHRQAPPRAGSSSFSLIEEMKHRLQAMDSLSHTGQEASREWTSSIHSAHQTPPSGEPSGHASELDSHSDAPAPRVHAERETAARQSAVPPPSAATLGQEASASLSYLASTRGEEWVERWQATAKGHDDPAPTAEGQWPQQDSLATSRSAPRSVEATQWESVGQGSARPRGSESQALGVTGMRARGLPMPDLTASRITKGLLLAGVTVVVLLLAAAVLPGAVGYAPVVVTSGSMEPVISPGDIAVTKKTDGSGAQVGDIVTYQSGSNLITHRIIEEQQGPEGQLFKLKGDHNTAPDPQLIPENRIVAKYVYRVPKMGFLVEFANSETGRVGLIVVPAAVLALMWLRARDRQGTLRPQGVAS